MEYSLGIDLGTSNCALAFSRNGSSEIIQIGIQQLLSKDTIGEKTLLPSAYYIPFETEFDETSAKLPWRKDNQYITGHFAREHGSNLPTRLVTSAKSWLCDRRFNPNNAILPWKSELENEMVSPCTVTEALLEHLLNAYLHFCSKQAPKANLDNTAVTLTVPASFDEIARNETFSAAERAGWKNVTLLEEPQAAFYSWLNQENSNWRDQAQPGDLVLVCDIGGGTSDFTLIVVSEEEGELALNRICVGNHLLLGGDNIDLAIAYTLKFQAEAEGKNIDDDQLKELVYAARSAKEKFAEDKSIDSIPISVSAKGSGLFASTVSLEFKRDTLNQIIDGFFPATKIDDLPQNSTESGLQELGLKYEAEPVITKHIAAFLHSCKDAIKNNQELQKLAQLNASSLEEQFIKPSAVLFNGGVFNSLDIKEKVLSTLKSWSGKDVRELTGNSLDLSVAKGAAAYGNIKNSGEGLRIRAGSANSYYIGIESSMPAIPGFKPPVSGVCIVPYGMEEGEEQVLKQRSFGLRTGKSVSFRFFSSTTRTQDELGSTVNNAEKELEESQSLQVEITLDNDDNGQIVPVELHTKLTELGTLELWMQNPDSGEKWKLEFDVRTK